MKRRLAPKASTRLDVSDDEKRRRLKALGAEPLAEALVNLGYHHPQVEDLIQRLIATPEQNIQRFKNKLANLSCRDRFYEWDEAREFARELESLLEDLKVGAKDPSEGVALLIAFFERDSDVFEQCDDSTGSVSDVFCEDAVKLLGHFATQCQEKDWIIDELLRLYSGDPYGARGRLFDNATEYLPEVGVRRLIEGLWKGFVKDAKDYNKALWTAAIASLARQLRDPALLVKAREATRGELSAQDFLEIARLCLDGGDAAAALEWLTRSSEQKNHEYNSLLLAVHEKLGHKDERAIIAWRMFRERRSKETLEELLAVIGSHQRTSVINQTVKEIASSESLRYSDVQFLLDGERIDAAEEYLLKRARQIHGGLYFSVLPIARAFETRHRYLTATMLYRSLLDAILRRAYAKAYHHGVEYLRKLDELAPNIKTWGDLIPHTGYIQELRITHGRKSSFWRQYRENSTRL